MSQKHLQNVVADAPSATESITVNETVLREFRLQAEREGYLFNDMVEEMMLYYLQFVAKDEV